MTPGVGVDRHDAVADGRRGVGHAAHDRRFAAQHRGDRLRGHAGCNGNEDGILSDQRRIGWKDLGEHLRLDREHDDVRLVAGRQFVGSCVNLHRQVGEAFAQRARGFHDADARRVIQRKPALQHRKSHVAATDEKNVIAQDCT